MNPSVTLERYGAVAVMLIDNPPVNALSPAVIDEIAGAVDQFIVDETFSALLVHCAGKTFVAGADIAIFDRPDFTSAVLNAAIARMEASTRPVVAVLHGTALGGGLEVALACHYRIAVPGTRVGLPEVKLGILPGSLGTQRLPRLTGPAFALEAIQTGRMISATEALDAGIIDTLVEGDPLTSALAYVADLLARDGKVRRSSERSAADKPAPEGFFEQARQQATTRRAAYPAARAIVEAVEAAVTRPFPEGEAIESRLLMELVRTPQSAALRHLFFAERAAAKIPSLAKEVAPRAIRSVGIVGAGTMGGGIAMNFANVGIPVILVETSETALQVGMQRIHDNYKATQAKGRLTEAQVAQRFSCIRGGLGLQELAQCDLVIEAVFENMELKKGVCAELGRVCKPVAIIATNTSTLDVDALAAASGRPQDFIGMHFFSPANVMRLLEIVRGAQTAPEVLVTAMKLARSIGKVPVVSGVCYGFIGNRMAEPYMRETEFLLMEGASPAQIDRVAESIDLWGMAMGPCRMLDMAGIDVGAKTLIERAKEGALPADPAYRAAVLKMNGLGRFGQKTGAGYYRYEGRAAASDAETDLILASLATQHGIVQRSGIADLEIFERLFFPMVNEGMKILEEGIAYRAGDIDIVWTAGYGFPDHRGGPMFMADRIGFAHIAERLAFYARQRGDDHGYWTPSELLLEHAASGDRITEHRAGA